jgi:hypothetical protein
LLSYHCAGGSVRDILPPHTGDLSAYKLVLPRLMTISTTCAPHWQHTKHADRPAQRSENSLDMAIPVPMGPSCLDTDVTVTLTGKPAAQR